MPKLIFSTFLLAIVLFCKSIFIPTTANERSIISKRMSCLNTVPAESIHFPDPHYQAKYHTIAHQFLDTENGVQPSSPQMVALLDVLIDEAVTTLPNFPHNLSIAEERKFALARLDQIDCILLRHGFVYPAHGTVQLLSDALSPIYYEDPHLLHELMGQKFNTRRRAFIGKLWAGPFYVADCDTGAYIYIAIAQILGYPLYLVEIPNHIFVRWIFATGDYINYETMEGLPTDDRYYQDNWQIPDAFIHKAGILQAMSTTEAIAYHAASVGEAWSWQQNDEQMLKFYQYSIQLDASRSFAFNNLAWYYMFTPDTKQRNTALALKYAKLATDNLPTGDNLDTLACAYAAVGEYHRALNIAKQAASTYTPLDSDVTGHSKLFSRKHRCNNPGFGRNLQPFK